MMEAAVVYNHDVPLTELGGGVSRKVLAYKDQMMIVEVHFEKDGVGSVHTHPHVQSTYVQSGRFRLVGNSEIRVNTRLAKANCQHLVQKCVKRGDVCRPRKRRLLSQSVLQ